MRSVLIAELSGSSYAKTLGEILDTYGFDLILDS